MVSSQFKIIVDKRIEQGFTVYHSEPIGAKYNLSDGLTGSDIFGFKDLDKRFKYIADKGLVHANAQLFSLQNWVLTEQDILMHIWKNYAGTGLQGMVLIR